MAGAALLIGGTLGAWAVERAEAALVTCVVTADDRLGRRARARGLEVVPHHGELSGGRALSVHYPRILQPAEIDRLDGVWNLHPGLLPYGRGMYPVFWALWEGTPAGATVHEISPALDAGPVVQQIPVRKRADDTGGSLHARVQQAEQELFDRWWPRLAAGRPMPAQAQTGPGTMHARADFVELKTRGWRELAPHELARLERCLAFPGHCGISGGRSGSGDS